MNAEEENTDIFSVPNERGNVKVCDSATLCTFSRVNSQQSLNVEADGRAGSLELSLFKIMTKDVSNC